MDSLQNYLHSWTTFGAHNTSSATKLRNFIREMGFYLVFFPMENGDSPTKPFWLGFLLDRVHRFSPSAPKVNHKNRYLWPRFSVSEGMLDCCDGSTSVYFDQFPNKPHPQKAVYPARFIAALHFHRFWYASDAWSFWIETQGEPETVWREHFVRVGVADLFAAECFL